MAYGYRNTSTAVNDGGSRRKEEQPQLEIDSAFADWFKQFSSNNSSSSESSDESGGVAVIKPGASGGGGYQTGQVYEGSRSVGEEQPAPQDNNDQPWNQIVQPKTNEEEEPAPTPQEPINEQPAPAPAPVTTPINTGRLGTSLLAEPLVEPVTEGQENKNPSPSDFLAPYRNQPKALNSVLEKNDEAPLTNSIMYQDWQNLINSGAGSGAGASEIPFSSGTPQQDVSVLGNGYVHPVTFSGANQPGARGTTESELRQAAALAAMNANPYYQDPAVLDAVAQLRQNALDQINQPVTPMPQGPQTSGYFSGANQPEARGVDITPMPQGPQTSGYFSGANQPGARGVPDNGILFGGNGSTLPAPQVVDRNAPDYQPPSYGAFNEVVSDIINAGNSSRAADDWVNSHIPENATWDTIDQIRDNLYTQYYDGIENGMIAAGTPVTPKDVNDWINNNIAVDENTQQKYDQYEAATQAADNAGLETGSPEYYNYVNNYLDRDGTPGGQRYVLQTGSATGGTSQPTTTAPQTTGSGSSGKNFAEGLGDWISGLFGGNNADGSNGTPRPGADAYLNSTQGGTTTPQGGTTSGNTPQTGARMTPDEYAKYLRDAVSDERYYDDLMQMAAPGVDANGNLNTAAQALLMGLDKSDPYSGRSGQLSTEQILHLFDKGGAFADPASGVNINDAFRNLIADNPSYAVGNPDMAQLVDLTEDQYKEQFKEFLKANPLIQALAESGTLSADDIMNNFFKGRLNGNGTGSGSGSSKPDGSKKYQPSYEQGGQVVKAPYKKGGYSEDELKKMGNKPYKDYRGNTAYEGYYYWNGRWYPVDQDKANYYNYYGTYDGYNDDMKRYYNTFGTYYGYRPGWRTAGRAVSSGGIGGYGGGGYGGGSYSSSYSNSGYNNSSTPSTKNQDRNVDYNIMKNWAYNN